MFEKLMTDAREQMKPMLDVVALNTSTMEKVAKQNGEALNDAFNKGVEHARKVTTLTDPNAFVEAQQSYAKDLGEAMVNVGKANIEVFNEAREQYSTWLQNSFSAWVPAVAPAAKTARKAA